MEQKSNHRADLAEIIDAIEDSYRNDSPLNRGGGFPLPSREMLNKIIEDLEAILFFGYSGGEDVPVEYRRYRIAERVVDVFEALSAQIARSFRHECTREHKICDECHSRGQQEATALLRKVPRLREILSGDLRAAYDGDPAAKSYDEIIFSYPGFKAVTIYRVAHELHEQGVPLLPRIMTEYAHTVTGIDIHPGAHIGRSFFIDHGTGVVIGETCVIGDDVKIYQGVTLGALSFAKDANGRLLRGHKRHPTIEDGVTIYSGATILGGNTVIGANSVIGGNVWLTQSVPPNTQIVIEPPPHKVRSGHDVSPLQYRIDFQI